MEIKVPPMVRTQVGALKDALVKAVDESMRCAIVSEGAAAMEATLAKRLDANQPEKPFTPQAGEIDELEDGVYGATLKVAVSTPANAQQLRAVEVSFGIECGDDTVLMLYEAKSEGWRRVLRWQSPEYADISGAFGDLFAYAVIPGAMTSEMRMVVAHGTPWCTSRFSGFAIDVLAPAVHGDTPRVVWHTARGYSRGDFATSLRATRDGFELRINEPTMDANVFERTVVYHYRISGDHVERIEPIALNGRGFVEEWLDMPWDEAKGQTSVDAAEPMKIVHDRYSESQKDTKTFVSYSYGPVRACLVKGRYEVEMDADPGGPQYFAIKQGQNGYTMVNFGTTQDERCGGPDLMKRH